MTAEVKGIKGHAFLQEMERIKKTNSILHGLIIGARKRIQSNQHARLLNGQKELPKEAPPREGFDEKFKDVPPECYKDVKPLNHKELDAVANGKSAPTQELLRIFALSYGIVGKEQDAFLQAGQHYAEECHAVSTLVEAKPSFTAAADATDAQEKTLPAILNEILKKRWINGGIVMPAKATSLPSYCKKMSATGLHQVLGFPKNRVVELFAGRIPNADMPAAVCDNARKLVIDILDRIQATGQERKDALEAFDRAANVPKQSNHRGRARQPTQEAEPYRGRL